MILRIGVNHNFRDVEAELQTLPGRIDEGLFAVTEEATHLVALAYSNTINRKTGRTAETIEEDVTFGGLGSVTGYVGSNDEQAERLEYGTAAHIIRAVNAQALHFFIDGRWVFAHSVHHPGTPAYRPLLRATEESEAAVYQTYEDKIAEIFGDMPG